MRFRHTVVTPGLAVAAGGLPMTGTAAAADKGTATGWITVTDRSSGSPAPSAPHPVSGDVAGPFMRNAEEGVLPPRGSAAAYVERFP